MRRIGLPLLLACVGVVQIALPCEAAALSDDVCRIGERLKIHHKLHIDGQRATLRIGAGPRPTDRILAFMLRLILKHLMGFIDVEIFNADYSREQWLNEMACNFTGETDCLERPMLHIGVIETDDNRDTLNGYVNTPGELGPRLRRGWFLPSKAARSASMGESPEFWHYFTNPDRAKTFAFNEKQLDVSTVIPDRSGKRWCSPPAFTECDESGQFVPNWCWNQTCATVLAAFPHESYHALVKQIRELKLFVKVAWVGNYLDTLVGFYKESNIIFFDYSISSMTHDRAKITEVLFPSCDTSGLPKGCIYHSARMRKLVWQNIRHGAKQIYRLMENIKLTGSEYEKLLSLYNLAPTSYDEDLLNMACDLYNTQWKSLVDGSWMEGVSVYPELLVPIVVRDKSSQIPHATKLALTQLNNVNNVGLIPGYYMNQTVIYGNCNGDTVLDEYIQLTTRNDDQIVAVLGLECNRSLNNLVGLAYHYKHAVMSYRVDGTTVNEQDGHDYYFRVAPDTSIVYEGYMHFFKRCEWHNFAYVYDSTAVPGSWSNNLHNKAETSDLSMAAVFGLHLGEDHRLHLGSIKKKGHRIIVADFQQAVGLQVMCMAYEMEMTWRQKYVWLLPPWLPEYWFNVSEEDLPTSCTKEQIEDAVNLTFTYRFKELEKDTFETDTTFPNVSAWKAELKETKVVPYAGYAFDAIWSLGSSLAKLKDDVTGTIPQLQDPIGKKPFMKQWINSIRNTQFNGVTGPVQFTNNGRKSSKVYLYHYVNNMYKYVGYFAKTKNAWHAPMLSQAQRTLSTIAQSKSSVDADDKLVFVRNIEWPFGRPTDGSKECLPLFKGIDNLLNVGCDTAKAIFIVVVVLASVITSAFVGGGLAYRRFEQKMREIEQQQVSPLSSLAEYELPEDSVRIYRLLGQGAFGKVYLGEYLKEVGCVLPVAVKAAKDPKNINAKMELLSEAEVMKRFEHVNILRLIGVITQHDKCQIVTDFMMFGNLRSYLQDRRHLAVKGELNAEHLTRMALDISRGLSYLASLNYVHGDLACRNCLVHETLTIKIADFGFCKNLVDSDYYRLVRSGPMPVRWMSPELLSSGVYHVQSDIWSFGVVLYEIVTFGAYPYSDLDDHKVQDYIRKGGFPTLPQKVSSKLEALFLQIWMSRKEDRPTALELFEILAADPELVHPSLEDGPHRLEYISLQAQESLGSMSSEVEWTNKHNTRSPTGSAHSVGQRIRFSTTTGAVRIDIA